MKKRPIKKLDIIAGISKVIDIKANIENKIDSVERGIEYRAESVHSIFFGVDHKNLREAIVADLIDAIPVIGEVTNISRIRNTNEKDRKTLQSIDLAMGVVPFADLLLPTNTILHIEKIANVRRLRK